jgi:MFS transporter, DHA2 family, multidrug resistance protein
MMLLINVHWHNHSAVAMFLRARLLGMKAALETEIGRHAADSEGLPQQGEEKLNELKPCTPARRHAILSTIRVGEKLLQKLGPRKPMLIGCWITAAGILLTTSTFLLAREYLIAAIVGFTLFGIGLGLYATPSTDAALSNVPQDKAGSASGIYKMASSLGAAFGVAISAAIFTGLSHLQGLGPIAEIAMGRTDNVNVRFAASMALIFNVVMVVIAIVAIAMTVPQTRYSSV